jgi:FkbM family methyltransferase
MENRVVPWFNARGDQTFRLDYDLSSSSTVIDLGGYEGQWASDIFSRYLCTIHIFEPVAEFADLIEQRFAANDRIILHRTAVGGRESAASIGVNGDRSSMLITAPDSQSVRVEHASSAIQAISPHIDLIKINVEGAEYDILEDLIATGVVKQIGNIQVQFHDFVANAETRRTSLHAKLNATHELTYEFPFVWENWRLK